ncbi:MAG: DUF1573 domain-containing protein [Bacteroidetes bacterium]|nr:DUF1573 domain-containing protein [Bacteroidota bacterium]
MTKFVLALLIVSVAAAVMPRTADAQLKVVGGSDISFGRVYQTGKLVHKKIALKNVGEDTISIGGITTSCGCTVASISDSLLAPGKEIEVKIQFNPTGYIGEVTKYVYITNSYPESRLVTVKMTGNVVYALQPTPSYIVFNSISKGEPDSASVTLSNTSDETIRITKVELPSPDLTYRLHKSVLKPGEFSDLDIYVDSTADRSIDGYIRVITTSKLQPVLQLRMFVGVIGN